MAMSILSDFSIFLNQQIHVQEQMEAYLAELEALIAVSLTVNNFYELSKLILHHYFSVVANLLTQLSTLNQSNLAELEHKKNISQTIP